MVDDDLQGRLAALVAEPESAPESAPVPGATLIEALESRPEPEAEVDPEPREPAA
jgi:hypothetical protein